MVSGIPLKRKLAEDGDHCGLIEDIAALPRPKFDGISAGDYLIVMGHPDKLHTLEGLSASAIAV